MREYMEKNVKSALSKPLRGRYRRFIAIGVSALLSISTFLTVIPQTATTVYADNDKTITGLCTGAIANPAPGAGGWSYVYYGKYNNAAMKYRVLDKAATQFNTNTTMLLDCDSKIIGKNFDASSNLWSSSEIKGWLNGNDFYGSTDVFTVKEREAIASSTKNSAATGDGGGWVGNLEYAPLTGEHVFLLDAVEATRTSYGYANTNAADANRSKSGTNIWWWWLRSPYYNDTTHAGNVATSGVISYYSVAYGVAYDGGGVSPALNLDLESVIFSSVISGTSGSAGAEYKLTIADSNLGITPGTITRSGTTITVPYTITGTNKNNATQVSVLIMDSAYSAGTATTSGYTYTKLSVNSWNISGTGTFTLPDKYAAKTCGTDYHAYILAEDVNAGNSTDYASTPVEITIPDILVPVTGVTISPKETELKPGASQKLTHTIAPDNATNKNVKWSTSKPSVATVDNDGKVTAVDEGEAIITVTTEDGDFTDTCKVTVRKDAPGPTPTPTPTVTPTPTPTPRPKWRPHHHDDDDADDIPSEPAKPAAVNPDTVEGFFTALGQPVPGVTMGRTVQGVAAQAVLNAARPAGYVQAFTFNMAVNGKVEYTLKNGVLTIIIPKEFRKAGRTFAIMALDKNGKAVIFNDTDTNADTVTAAINVEGYAFSLIYKD